MDNIKDGVIGGSLMYMTCTLLNQCDWKRTFVSVLTASMCSLFTRALIGLKREKYPLELWIDSGVREAAIDQGLPIIDSHHHLWDARTQPKGWPISPWMLKFLYVLKPNLTMTILVVGQDRRIINTFTKFLPMGIPYMTNEMRRDIENEEQGGGDIQRSVSTKDMLPGHNVRATVYVESGWVDPAESSNAMKAVTEAGMAQKVADVTENRFCTGIVAHVPLKEGADAVRPALQALVERYPNVRGIRDSLACPESEEFYPFDVTRDLAYDPKFRSAFSLLSKFNLTYDCWLYQENIEALRDLARAFPDTTIVCDHVGGPFAHFSRSNSEERFRDWAKCMKDLAERCPRVVVKLSGLGLCWVDFGFHLKSTPVSSRELAAAWKPYVRHCIECFGVDRCMFASNFPVDKVSCSYTALFNAFKTIVKDFSVEDRTKLFHDNAARIYKLKIISKF